MMILLLSAIAKISIGYIRKVLIPELEKKRVGALQRTRYASPTTGKKQVMNIFLKAASFDFYWRMRVNQGCKEGEMTYWEKVSACQNFGGFETVHKAGKRPIWVNKISANRYENDTHSVNYLFQWFFFICGDPSIVLLLVQWVTTGGQLWDGWLGLWILFLIKKLCKVNWPY